jgi:hypothetical protein
MATPASTRDKRLRLIAEAMNCAIPDDTAVKDPRVVRRFLASIHRPAW